MSRVVIGRLIAGIEVILSLVTYLPLSVPGPDRSANGPTPAEVFIEQDPAEIEWAGEALCP